MRLLFIIIATLSLSIQALAQVASPSLDPSIESNLPSVTSLRPYNTVAIRYGTGTWERATSEATIEGDLTSTGGIIALNLDGLGLEAFMNNQEIDATLPPAYGGGEMPMENNESQIGISYLIGELLSIGVGQYTYY